MNATLPRKINADTSTETLLDLLAEVRPYLVERANDREFFWKLANGKTLIVLADEREPRLQLAVQDAIANECWYWGLTNTGIESHRANVRWSNKRTDQVVHYDRYPEQALLAAYLKAIWAQEEAKA